MDHRRSAAINQLAQQLMPAGVNSPVRAFRAVGGEPVVFESAAGAYLTDVDGNRYIDYVGSWGPMILGHSHPAVVEAVTQMAQKAMSFGAPHEGELLLAQKITQLMPHIEMMRFVCSGTEATMSAVRLARGSTNRPYIIKFEGCYHGHVDSLLVKAGSGLATFGLPECAGIPPEMTANTLLAGYNHLDEVEQLFTKHGSDIAGVIVEPVAGNMGVVPPAPGFLEGLRRLCTQYGALLIFDEVMNCFRVALSGATELTGITPDIVCLGKIVGGGLPVAVYGGRRELMQHIAPLGAVYQAGTLSGNPLGMAAGLATLNQLTPVLYSKLEANCQILEDGLNQAASDLNVPMQLNRVGAMLSCYFTTHAVVDTDTAMSTNRELFAKLFSAMLERGIYLPPSALEAWFVSAAHTPADIQQTIEAFRLSLQEAIA